MVTGGEDLNRWQWSLRSAMAPVELLKEQLEMGKDN